MVRTVDGFIFPTGGDSDPPSLRILGPEPVPDWLVTRNQMADAFKRWAASKRWRTFDSALKSWIKERKKSGLPVDYMDPDAIVPSGSFRSLLRSVFKGS